MHDNVILLNPRVIVVQKLYGHHLNKKNKGKEAARAVMSVLGILKNESK